MAIIYLQFSKLNINDNITITLFLQDKVKKYDNIGLYFDNNLNTTYITFLIKSMNINNLADIVRDIILIYTNCNIIRYNSYDELIQSQKITNLVNIFDNFITNKRKFEEVYKSLPYYKDLTNNLDLSKFIKTIKIYNTFSDNKFKIHGKVRNIFKTPSKKFLVVDVYDDFCIICTTHNKTVFIHKIDIYGKSYVNDIFTNNANIISLHLNKAMIIANAYLPGKPTPYISFKDTNINNFALDNLEWSY